MGGYELYGLAVALRLDSQQPLACNGCGAHRQSTAAMTTPRGLVIHPISPSRLFLVRVATEGALWGAVNAHGFLCEAVVVSDDAGQFNVGQHALCCWCGRPPTASMCQNEVV